MLTVMGLVITNYAVLTGTSVLKTVHAVVISLYFSMANVT
jgi:hypothetical protein